MDSLDGDPGIWNDTSVWIWYREFFEERAPNDGTPFL